MLFSGRVTPQFPEPVGTLVSINWLYFTFFLFVFTCLLIFAVSAVTKRATAEQLQGLTFAPLTPEQRVEERRSYDAWDIYTHAPSCGVAASCSSAKGCG